MIKVSWVKLRRAGDKAISVAITPELSKLCKKYGVNFAVTSREAVVEKIKTIRENEPCRDSAKPKKERLG